MSSDGLIEAVKSWIRSQVVAPPLSEGEHAKFFQFGLGLSGQEANDAAMVYLAACYAFSIDGGFGERRTPKFHASWKLDAEFKRAGLGTVVRSPDGKAHASLRTASHLQGKKNHREAIKDMAPSRRDALRAEIKKLLALPAAAWDCSERMVAVGVRG
jgi:hypothetical protein